MRAHGRIYILTARLIFDFSSITGAPRWHRRALQAGPRIEVPLGAPRHRLRGGRACRGARWTHAGAPHPFAHRCVAVPRGDRCSGDSGTRNAPHRSRRGADLEPRKTGTACPCTPAQRRRRSQAPPRRPNASDCAPGAGFVLGGCVRPPEWYRSTRCDPMHARSFGESR